MAHKYGIYQSTSKSCIFYKQDKDGRQSTFNIFVAPENEDKSIKKVFAFIDNEQMQTENWFAPKESNIRDVVDAFGGWASDAPIVFEIEAHRSLSHCLSSMIKEEAEE